MKKYNPISDVRNNQIEVTRRVNRAITEVIRQLDDVRGRAQCVADLFSPSATIQRVKLQELCMKLIFTDPIGYAKKGEDLLWKKGYHDVFTTSKRLRKGDVWLPEEAAYVQGLLISGVGHYQHFLFTLQSDFKFYLERVLDFPLFVTSTGIPKGKNHTVKEKQHEATVTSWARECCHHCLIYLGDLNRYLIDLYPTWELGVAERYYLQAIKMNYSDGRPYNQLGTLSGSKNYNLDAVYYFVKCLSCKEPFPGAEGNLLKTLTKNKEVYQTLIEQHSTTLQKLIINFLILFECWFFDKDMNTKSDTGVMCHEFITSIQKCYQDGLVPNNCMEQFILLLLTCADKLIRKDSIHSVNATTMVLAVLSQVTNTVVTQLVQHYTMYNISKLKTGSRLGNRLKRLKRRRKVRNNVGVETCTGASDSDEEDSPSDKDSCSEESSCDGDGISDEDLSSGGEDMDSSLLIIVKKAHDIAEGEMSRSKTQNKVLNGKNKTESLSENMSSLNINNTGDVNHSSKGAVKLDCKQLAKHMTKIKQLESVKLGLDWLKCHEDIIKNSNKTCKTLMSQLVVLLNLINFEDSFYIKAVGIECCTILKTGVDKIPISTDYSVRGVAMLNQAHDQLEWTDGVGGSVEETCLLLMKLVQFGNWLAEVNVANIWYNNTTRLFGVRDEGENGKIGNHVKDEKKDERKGQLMKNMGQLWLKAEVLDLESRVRHRAANFSPYLVVDSEALIEHIPLVKQLVGSRQFIVVIPLVVLSHLDEFKRDSGRARETIRWLESQFQHGNRSLRAQKSQEKFSLPLIKYPKKKDKDAWNFFQIAECCHYFSKQSEFQSCRSNLLVTLLTGQRDVKLIVGENKKDDYSPLGVAKNIGLNLEHIESFHTKWKLSSKSHG